MSSSTASELLRVVVNPSRLAFIYLLLAHSLAFWAVLQSGFYLLLPVIPLSLFYYECWRRRYVFSLLFRGAACSIEQKGRAIDYNLGRRHFVCGLLVIVQLQTKACRPCRYLVLFRDAVEPDTFRRLRVYLCFRPSLPKHGSSLGLK